MFRLPRHLQGKDIIFTTAGILDAKTKEIYIGLQLTESQVNEFNSEISEKIIIKPKKIKKVKKVKKSEDIKEDIKED